MATEGVNLEGFLFSGVTKLGTTGHTLHRQAEWWVLREYSGEVRKCAACCWLVEIEHTSIFHQQLPTYQRPKKDQRVSLPPIPGLPHSQSGLWTPERQYCVHACVCVHAWCMHVKGRARNSQIVAAVCGKQLVLSTVFGREVWISLHFRSLCLMNNEIVTAVVFPKELCRLLFFCQTLTKCYSVCVGQRACRGSDMAAQSLGLAWTPGHVT